MRLFYCLVFNLLFIGFIYSSVEEGDKKEKPPFLSFKPILLTQPYSATDHNELSLEQSRMGISASIISEQHNIQKKWLLSLNGGGIRGVMQLNMLAEMEKYTGKSVPELFDAVSGTSIGGMIACLLTMPDPENPSKPKYSAQYLLNYLLDNKEKMFVYKWQSFGGFFRTKYKTTKVKELLYQLLGDNKFSERLIPTVVTTNDLRMREARFFSSKDEEDFFTRDIAMATSAAPTYFKPQLIFPINADKYHTGYFVTDGGTCMNNPVEIGKILVHKVYGIEKKFIEILSLGTGTSAGVKNVADLERGGKIAWSGVIAGTFVSGNASSAHYIAARTNGDRYHHYSSSISEDNVKLDNISVKNITDLLLASRRTMFKEKSNFFETIRKINLRA